MTCSPNVTFFLKKCCINFISLFILIIKYIILVYWKQNDTENEDSFIILSTGIITMNSLVYLFTDF